MIQITMKADFRPFRKLITALILFPTRHGMPIAYGVTITAIKENTDAGVDADEIPFHPYSEGHKKKREKIGLQTSRKDLKMSKRMMGSVGLYDNLVNVAPEFQEIAHGQMFHKNWQYHHLFLMVGDKTIKKIELAMYIKMMGLIA